ncbi:universal stress protein [Winogradskyella sp. DF17]|uniref:Universal stress protein n=1 Tax=Winogradskyella pelagia TaxID=2819984 RepID=A0ABS3T2I9_9FLAO|nr:universal stress protein [Winogradskyella sp. DF17]MBO3115945.1 universal stress protein [Winogradskyella sp. DF17]
MKTILYATDCTKKSVPELKYAYRLSKALKAELHAIHVYDLLPIVSTTVRSRGVLEDNFDKEQQDILQDYCLKYLKKDFKSPIINGHALKSDSISKAILKTATTIDADLVIVGVKNPYSLRGIFTENIANQLMAVLSCPLLVLPEYTLYETWSKIIYATDFDEADIHALKRLADFVKPLNAQIEVVHIPRKNEDYHERKMEWFKAMVGMRIAYSNILFSSKQAEDVESGIQNFIEKDRPEILVMMERQRDRIIDKLLHKDLVKTMGYEISIPLLVFNKKRIKRKLSEQVDGIKKMSLAL